MKYVHISWIKFFLRALTTQLISHARNPATKLECKLYGELTGSPLGPSKPMGPWKNIAGQC